MTLSAAFTVNGDANPAAHSVAYLSTVNLALTSLTGVSVVTWEILSSSKSGTAHPAITPAGTPTGATASFAMPADPADGFGRSFVVRCTVSDGLNQAVEYSVIGAPNDAGLVPIAAGEEDYRDATQGWTDIFNYALNFGTISAQSWGSTLVVGADSGAINPRVSTGQYLDFQSEIDIRRQTSAILSTTSTETRVSSPGYVISTIDGVDSVSVFRSGFFGVQLNLRFAAYHSDTVITAETPAGGAGPNITIAAGTGDTGFNGGGLYLDAGAPGAGGVGGSVNIRDGAGNARVVVDDSNISTNLRSGGFLSVSYDATQGLLFGSLFGNPALLAYPEFDAGTGTDFYFITNDPAGNRAGMNFRFVAGAGGPGGDNAGGGFLWFAGDAVGNANGGGYAFTAGAGGNTSGAGGGFSFTCGSEDGGGNGGSISGTAGTSYSATAGSILWVGGEGAPAGNATLQGGPSASGGAGKGRLLGGDGTTGGVVEIIAGASTGASPAAVNITGGSGVNAGGVTIGGGTPSAGYGAGVDLVGSAGVGTDKAGGSITAIAGTSTGTADPGSLAFVAANATGSNNDGGVAGFGAGNGEGTGTGGGATLFAGDGGSSGGIGGPALVRGGDAGAAGVAGGEARVRGGAGTSTTSPGGAAILQGGAAGSTGSGGDASVLGGTPTDGNGGAVSLLGADGVSGATNRNGGQATVGAGDAALAGTGGSAFVTAGSGGATGTAGVAHLQGGAGGSTSGTGGNAMVEGGAAATHGDGGSVLINGGAAASTGGAKTGGSITLTPGALAGGGADGTVKLKTAGGTTRIEVDSTGLGFFATAPVAKPTITGSRGGNAALASLLTGLANLGLITDSTTA